MTGSVDMGDDCYLDENVEEDEAEPEAEKPEVEESEAKEPEQPAVQNMDDQEELTGRTALELLCRRDDSREKVKVLV